jgi:phosphoribosylpyrophosphate synthetase
MENNLYTINRNDAAPQTLDANNAIAVMLQLFDANIVFSVHPHAHNVEKHFEIEVKEVEKKNPLTIEELETAQRKLQVV